MQKNTADVLRLIGASEGGYVNHPKDPGGPTNLGVTQRTYDAWLRSRGRHSRDVRDITRSEADQIFTEQYLAPVRFDDLPDGLDYAMADFSVNSGPSRAVRTLQAVLNAMGAKLAVDGHLGVLTLAEIRARRRHVSAIIGALCDARLAFLRSLGTWGTFGAGWTKRVEFVRAQAIVAAGGAGTFVELPKPAPGRGSGEPMNFLEAIFAAIVAVLNSIVAALAGANARKGH